MLIGLCGFRAPRNALSRTITALTIAVFAVLSYTLAGIVGTPHAIAAPAHRATAGAAALATGYPPSVPCTLSWRESASAGSGSHTLTATVVGSGLDSSAPVTVTYYSAANRHGDALGSWRTDDDGAFSASVTLPDASQGSANGSWLSARTRAVGCKVPATTNGVNGAAGGQSVSRSAPGGGGAAAPYPPPPPGSTSTPAGTAPGPTTTPTPGGTSGPSSTGSSNTGSSNTGSTYPVPPIGSGGASGSGQNSPGQGSPGSGSPGSGSPGQGSPGQGSPGSGSGPATTSPRAASSSPTVSLGPQDWGLPTSFIVTMAVVLVLLGGVGVLVLTRRSG